MPATHALEHDNLRIDYAKLYFLLKDYPTLIFDIQIAEESFIGVAQSFNVRAQLHANEFQRKLDGLPLASSEEINVDELSFLIVIGLFIHLNGLLIIALMRTSMPLIS